MNPNTGNINSVIFKEQLKLVKDDMDTSLENLKAIKGAEFSFIVELLIRTETVAKTFAKATEVDNSVLRAFLIAAGIENVAEIPVMVARGALKMSAEEFKEAIEHSIRISKNMEQQVLNSIDISSAKVQ